MADKANGVQRFDWATDEDGFDLPAQLRGLGESLAQKGWNSDDVMLHHAADQLEALEAKLEAAEALASQIRTDWLPANEQLAARAEAAEQRVREVEAERNAAIRGLKAWAPILSEIERRAEKECCVEQRCDFTVTIGYDEYMAVDADNNTGSGSADNG